MGAQARFGILGKSLEAFAPKKAGAAGTAVGGSTTAPPQPPRSQPLQLTAKPQVLSSPPVATNVAHTTPAVADAFGASESYGKSIVIEGDEDFRRQTKASLDSLKGTPTGSNLLQSLDASGRTVTIAKTTDNNGYCKALSPDANMVGGKPGKGADSRVTFNPNFKPGGLPNSVVLGHELVHANHNAYGTRETGNAPNGVKLEELKTVGLPPYEDAGLTENGIRKDMNIARRASY